jgi:hypothetical protein
LIQVRRVAAARHAHRTRHKRKDRAVTCTHRSGRCRKQAHGSACNCRSRPTRHHAAGGGVAVPRLVRVFITWLCVFCASTASLPPPSDARMPATATGRCDSARPSAHGRSSHCMLPHMASISTALWRKCSCAVPSNLRSHRHPSVFVPSDGVSEPSAPRVLRLCDCHCVRCSWCNTRGVGDATALCVGAGTHTPASRGSCVVWTRRRQWSRSCTTSRRTCRRRLGRDRWRHT